MEPGSSVINIHGEGAKGDGDATTNNSGNSNNNNNNNNSSTSNNSTSNNGSDGKLILMSDTNNQQRLDKRPKARARDWFGFHSAAANAAAASTPRSSPSKVSELAPTKESGVRSLSKAYMNNIDMATKSSRDQPTINGDGQEPKVVVQIRLNPTTTNNIKRQTSDTYLNATTNQPTINITSNPTFSQFSPRKASNSTIEDTAATITVNQFNNSPQTTTTTKENSRPGKPKKRTTSLSASLRRLLTINFSRNSPSSSASTNNTQNINKEHTSVNPLSNLQSAASKQQGDKTSSKRHGGNKRSQMVSRRSTASVSSNGIQSILVSNHLVAHQEGALRNEKRSLSQPHTSAADKANLASNNNTRRQTISDTEKVTKNNIKQTSTPPSGWFPAADGADIAEIDGKSYFECPLCVLLVSESSTSLLEGCRHRVCLDCMQRYITIEINHSRLNITCPICSESIHPNTIKQILQNEKYYLKYESFMLRRVLAAEPDARWCPAPDCGYAVLANGCASCPKLVCGRDGCNTSFCYHCKQEWHPNQTCSAASIQRNKRIMHTYNSADLIEESNQSNRKSSKSSQRTGSIRADDIKECPVCASRIIKMNDGSCNHMTCSICETEFCWLCMKEISDLHYFSPSGCTFWGKKPWSRKKKLLWQLGMLVGAPICIILIAGIAVPAIVIGIPVWAARKLHTRLERKPVSRYKKNAIIAGGVLLSFVVSPIISAVALAIGIPILLGYVYGVVPLSLCRSSGGCLSSNPSLENLQHEFQASRSVQARDGVSIDTAMSNKLGDPSIGETSLYMSNISLETNSIGHVTTVEREDRESASNAALAGSIISATAEDANSTRALAGSLISKESGYTLIPAEIHSSGGQVVVAAVMVTGGTTNTNQGE